MDTVQVGQFYKFAPGGYAAYHQWYAEFTHPNQISGILETDVFKVMRFTDDKEASLLGGNHVQLEASGWIVLWMPVQHISDWLEPAVEA